MKCQCPVCKNVDHNEIDLHSDGYAKDIIECSTCGTIWLDDQGLANIIKASTEHTTQVAAH